MHVTVDGLEMGQRPGCRARDSETPESRSFDAEAASTAPTYRLRRPAADHRQRVPQMSVDARIAAGQERIAVTSHGLPMNANGRP